MRHGPDCRPPAGTRPHPLGMAPPPSPSAAVGSAPPSVPSALHGVPPRGNRMWGAPTPPPLSSTASNNRAATAAQTLWSCGRTGPAAPKMQRRRPLPPGSPAGSAAAGSVASVQDLGEKGRLSFPRSCTRHHRFRAVGVLPGRPRPVTGDARCEHARSAVETSTECPYCRVMITWRRSSGSIRWLWSSSPTLS